MQASSNKPQNSITPPTQAAPHVTGIVARCYAAGECRSETDTEAELITALSKEYNEANPKHGFSGDAVTTPAGAQYFGYAVFAGRW
jgi:hypothetical protein